jgi:hypothetical protein
MEAYEDLADDRLIDGCLYCGGAPNSREHVPSKSLLDDPKPDNLPVVGACRTCNNQFSSDEEYVACLVECVLAGSTDPDRIRRARVAKMLRHSPALRARLEGARTTVGNQTQFSIEVDRVRNVVRKLAQGHAAFELSQICRQEPTLIDWQPLGLLGPEFREQFEAPHIVSRLGEIGSRSTQRLMVIQLALAPTAGGEPGRQGFIVNDWVEVQEDRYRYLAIDDIGGIEIRMVIGEYLACKVCWSDRS